MPPDRETLAHLVSKWPRVRGSLANWAIVVLGLFAARGAGALALIVVARQVTPFEYGQYVSTYALMSLLLVLPNYGLDTWLLTREHSSKAELVQLWGRSIQSRFRLLVVWIAGVIVLGALLPRNTFPLAIVVPTVIGLALESLSVLSYAALRGLDQHGKVTLMQSASSLALLGIAFGLPIGPGQIQLFAVGRTAVSAILAGVVIPFVGRGYWGRFVDSLRAGSVLRSARPFMVAEVASAIYVKTDLTIVSFFLGSPGASVYGPALTLLQAVFLIPRALYYIVVPRLSQQRARTPRTFRRQGVTQLAAQGVAGAVLSLAVFLLAPAAVNLTFGPSYRDSALILVVLSPIPFFRSLNFAIGAMLAAGDRQPSRTKVQMGCAISSVLANLIAIPTLGVQGAAMTHVLSEMALCSGYLLLARDWLKPGALNSADTDP